MVVELEADAVGYRDVSSRIETQRQSVARTRELLAKVGKKGEFRSNLHRGGTALAIEITPEERRTAVRAANGRAPVVLGVASLSTAWRAGSCRVSTASAPSSPFCRARWRCFRGS